MSGPVNKLGYQPLAPIHPAVEPTKFNSFQDLKNSVMQQRLKQKFWAHILVNNPGLIIELEQQDHLNAYLESKIESVLPLLDQLTSEGKADYIIEELCIHALVAEMRPYRFNYLWNVLEQEFSPFFKSWEQDGILTFELINLQQHCKDTFDALGFTMDDAYEDQVYNAITGMIDEYLRQQY
ncbi:hypothetical protein [Dyadobacter frigoris]|uniref:DUF1896 domain-containing protein n=1 Tax=Dyadobacter frigoris TaxID=2576211 RepID=A0A4U6CSU5_9BACT|nr:hypothetical protein [Dyadobacter frigoris]TKT86008.1 hypothetical protein FDK13_32945 [Dyadobacter frigoris]